MKYKLINKTKNNVIVENIILADNFWTRMCGLMGKKELKNNEGLLLKPCNAVHMMFMRFPIDVIFLDKEFMVVKIIDNLRPWCTSPIVRDAFHVVELGAGITAQKRINIGDKLSLYREK